MKPLKYKRASGWSLWLLKAIRMYAIVMPWGVCYTRWTLPLWPAMQRHEEKRWEQYNRKADQYGSKRVSRWVFAARYLITQFRHGYKRNKFEIEAREAQEK